jgi:hypothetical protein
MSVSVVPISAPYTAHFSVSYGEIMQNGLTWFPRVSRDSSPDNSTLPWVLLNREVFLRALTHANPKPYRCPVNRGFKSSMAQLTCSSNAVDRQ